MVPRSTPASRIHTSKVDPDSASGSPDEKPSSSTISTRGCRYTAQPSRHEARAGDAVSADVSGAVMGPLVADSGRFGRVGRAERNPPFRAMGFAAVYPFLAEATPPPAACAAATGIA